MKAAAITLLLVAAGCHHDGADDPTYDFAGTSKDQSAVVEDAGTSDDGGDAIDGGVACDPGAALDGGSSVGSWVVQGGCATAEAFFQLTASCSSITYDTLAITAPSGGAPSGTLALIEPDGYTRSLTAQISARATVPKACVPSDCTSYATTTREQLGWLEIACVAQGNDCLCPISADISFATETGLWTPTASGFTLTPVQQVPQSFVTGVSADDDVLVVRGDEASLRGSRGVTLVLGK